METIYLLAYFADNSCSSSKRIVSLAATTKILYLSSLLSSAGFEVKILSLAPLQKGRCHFGVSESKGISSNVSVIYPPDHFRRTKLLRKIDDWLKKSWVFRYLKKDQAKKVICYHSLYSMGLYSKIKSRLSLKLILEVEEIYSDLPEYRKNSRSELSFFSIPDSFICITPTINELINLNHRPFAVFYGPYSPCKESAAKERCKIHVVYAGTTEASKGNLQLLLGVIRLLDERFVVHIFSSLDTEGNHSFMRKTLADIPTKCRVVYEGSKYGENLDEQISRYDIALNLQNPDGQFNRGSFPSKILLYMRNGLRVVATKSSSLLNSAFEDKIVFADYNPGSIVNAIQQIDLGQPVDYHRFLSNLEFHFKEELSSLLANNSK